MNGDPIAYSARSDLEGFSAEATTQRPAKFKEYELGQRRSDGEDKVRIFVHFAGGDTDETLLIRVGGRWYVADPIHIIR